MNYRQSHGSPMKNYHQPVMIQKFKKVPELKRLCTCRGVLVVEGGARGGVKVDLLGGGCDVAADERVACNVSYVLNEVHGGLPADFDGGGDVAPLVLEVWISKHLFFHLDKEKVL